MKNSIRFKLTFLLMALIIITIFLTWFINRTFLSDYYERYKVKTLTDVYRKVKEIYEGENSKDAYEDEGIYLSEEATLAMERLSSSHGVNIYVIKFLAWQMVYNYPEPGNLGEREKFQINLLINYYLDRQNTGNTTLIKDTDEYMICNLYDEHYDANYLDLVGTLGHDKIIFLRSNFESIQEGVNIANRFLAYIGIGAVIIGSIVMMLISKSFTKPILELSEIAKKMSDLDFEVKYQGKTNDEIDTLGNSINSLSDKLKSTVSELKSANNELMTDIQKKIEIDEMRKEFLSNVSHELKTPISLIQGYAEGLKENINDDKENRDFYCEVIMDEADKMNKMVKKLLTLNELESGQNPVNFERFDLTALVRAVLDSVDILLRQKEVRLYFAETSPVYVWADEYMVEQVVTNYISNAIHHVNNGGIIEIKFIIREDVVRVAVFNTGENIPEDELDKIWIKFYKVDKARTREYGGSGIGLSIVKAVMNSLNRDCGVKNHPSGVEFWFELDIRS
jgi:two-component system sensor histidine kinase VanS